MGRTKKSSESGTNYRVRPGLTPEADEMQLISMAVDLAKQQLQDGTASSQVITHFLKLGSTREKLERERLIEENKLLKAKTKAYESSEEIKVLYSEALKAMRKYSGQGDVEEYDYEGDEDDY